MKKETMKKTPSRVKKKKKKKIILLSIFSVFLLLFIISLLNITIWSIDSHNNEQLKKELEDTTKIELKPAEAGTSFWDTDISALKEKNADTIGWLHMNGTEINYPFVQASDNYYYLYRDFNKKSSNAGWIFMDYRNKKDLTDKNIILYGHNRTNKAMFGSLQDILDNGWIKNKDNYYIQTSTEKMNMIWEVFSVYHIETTSDYLQVNFKNDEEYMYFISKLKDRSGHQFNVEVTKTDQIITLSTCYGENHRTVVHAKLVEKSPKEN